MIKPLLNKLKQYSAIRNAERQIKKIEKIFTEKDFRISKKNNKYKIFFNNRFGYKKSGYSPVFYFDEKNNYWVIKVENLTVLARQNPCFTLINELRGYTLLDDLKKDDIAIDVGASDGFISCYLGKKAGKTGKVIALEPDLYFQKILDENIRINKLDNVITIFKALFNKNGRYRFQSGHSGSSKISQNGSFSVGTIILEDLIKKFRLNKKRIKFIKLDIEGSEIKIIDDLISFVVKNLQTVVCIASYHEYNGQPTYQEIERKCRKATNIFAKTIYPYHTTTFIVNRKSPLVKKLEKFPAYEEMNKIIWN